MASAASVYVGDMSLEVTEEELRRVMARFGNVVSISMRRDMRTNLGYAYVTMATPQQAEAAIRGGNYVPLKGRPIRVMAVVLDSKARKTGLGNLHISGVPPSVMEKDLDIHFGQVGPVTSCKIARDQFGEPLGYGYVAYDTQDLADKAIQQFDQTLLGESVITVRNFTRSAQRKGAGYTNLYIKGLKADVTDAELSQKFSEFGQVTSVLIRADTIGRKFAFVSFGNADSAQKAVDELHDAAVETLSDTKLYVQRAMTRAQRDQELKKQFDQEAFGNGQVADAPPMMPMPMPMPGMPMMYPPPPMMMPMPMHYPAGPAPGFTSLFFRVDNTVSQAAVRAACSEFGNVVSLKVRSASKPSDDSFTGFVTFETPQQAAEALALRGRTLVPGTRPAHFAPGNKNHNANPASRPPSHAAPPPAMWNGPPPPAAMFNGPVQGRGLQAMPPMHTGAPMNGAGKGAPSDAFQNQHRGHPGNAAPTSQYFSSLSGEKQREAVENELRKKITSARNAQLAQKVTPALMRTYDIAELLNLLDSPQSLDTAVDQALTELAPRKPAN